MGTGSTSAARTLSPRGAGLILVARARSTTKEAVVYSLALSGKHAAAAARLHHMIEMVTGQPVDHQTLYGIGADFAHSASAAGSPGGDAA